MSGITLIESHNYTQMVNQIGDPKWVDELQESIVSTISANPFVGDPISQYVYAIESRSSVRLMSGIRVTYSYDPDVEPNYVELLSIELIG